MRRIVFTALGGLEFLAALTLLALGWQLPGPAAVRERAGRVEDVSRQAGDQVRRLRSQVDLLRQRRPQADDLARQVDAQVQAVGAVVRNHQLNFAAVGAVSDALGDVAEGLDGLSATLDPAALAQLADGLKGAADFLDTKLVPAAEQSAGRLEQSAGALKADAERLAVLLKAAGPDLRPAREAVAGLARLEESLGRMARLARGEGFAAMKDGLKGLETSLEATAGQVEKFSDLLGPLAKADEKRPADGKAIAAGLRKASRGAGAAGQEMAALEAELPGLRTSLEQTRAVVGATRQTLDAALTQRDKLEPTSKFLHDQATRLTEELPRLAADVAKVLRDAGRLREIARTLREAHKGTAAAAARWPQVRRNLGKTAEVLRQARTQMQQALAGRERYEEAVRRTLAAAETFAGTLPEMTAQLDDELTQQQEGLTALGESLDRVSEVVPEVSDGAVRWLGTARLLFGLVGVIVALHAGWVVANAGTSPGRPA